MTNAAALKVIRQNEVPAGKKNKTDMPTHIQPKSEQKMGQSSKANENKLIHTPARSPATMSNNEPNSAQIHSKSSRTGKRRAAKKGAALAKNAQQTNTLKLTVASSYNAYNTSSPVFNMAKSATMVNVISNQGNSPAPTLPLAEKRKDIATSKGDMAAIQQQAMRHVITITNSIFFLMANSRTLATADTVSFMDALACILSELGVNTQAHQTKIDKKNWTSQST
jgi:hypothetical protein